MTVINITLKNELSILIKRYSYDLNDSMNTLGFICVSKEKNSACVHIYSSKDGAKMAFSTSKIHSKAHVDDTYKILTEELMNHGYVLRKSTDYGNAVAAMNFITDYKEKLNRCNSVFGAVYYIRNSQEIKIVDGEGKEIFSFKSYFEDIEFGSFFYALDNAIKHNNVDFVDFNNQTNLRIFDKSKIAA